MRVIADQTGLVAGAHPVDIRFGGIFGSADFVVLVHAAGNIDHQHGGHRNGFAANDCASALDVHRLHQLTVFMDLDGRRVHANRLTGRVRDRDVNSHVRKSGIVHLCDTDLRVSGPGLRSNLGEWLQSDEREQAKGQEETCPFIC